MPALDVQRDAHHTAPPAAAATPVATARRNRRRLVGTIQPAPCACDSPAGSAKNADADLGGGSACDTDPVAAIGKGSRACRIRQLGYGGDESEAAAWHGLDIATVVGIVVECAPQAGDDLAQAVFLDHQTRPQRLHQRILVEQCAGVFDEQQQRAEQPGRKVERTAVTTAHSLLRPLQHEITEGISLRCEHCANSDFIQKCFRSRK